VPWVFRFDSRIPPVSALPIPLDTRSVKRTTTRPYIGWAEKDNEALHDEIRQA